MIRAILDKHLSKAFDNQLSDAVRYFTGSRSMGSDGYDPVTGQVSAAAKLEYVGRGTLSQFDATELLAPNIDVLDIKLSCLQSEVEQKQRSPVFLDKSVFFDKRSTLLAAIDNGLLYPVKRPLIDDIIMIEGQEKRVISVSQDSVAAMWIIQLRGQDVGY